MIRSLIVIAVHIVWFAIANDISFYDSMLYEGDPCTLADGVTSATCRLDTNCLYLKTIPQKDWRTCSFERNSSVVCCLNKRPPSAALQDTRGRFNYKSDEMCANFPDMPETTNHILNGTIADADEFPYLGALAFQQQHSSAGAAYGCGANLISDRFMLTAAHCLVGRTLDHVRLGVVSLLDDQNDGDDPVIIGVEKVFIHPNYTRRPITRNDIALLKLNRTVDEDFLVPACLYTEPTDPLPSVPLTIAGWGGTDSSNDGSMSSILMKAQVAPINRDECNATLAQMPTFKRNVQLHNDQLCALGRDERNDATTNDTCVGDSGGPLELTIRRRKYIVGLTSTGKICGTTFPSIYTRVSQFIDWIEAIVWP